MQYKAVMLSTDSCCCQLHIALRPFVRYKQTLTIRLVATKKSIPCLWNDKEWADIP